MGIYDHLAEVTYRLGLLQSSSLHMRRILRGADPDPSQVLYRLKACEDHVNKAIRAAVTHAHEDGMSWAQIGVALGVSRQAVWERYGPSSSTDTGLGVAQGMLPGM